MVSRANRANRANRPQRQKPAKTERVTEIASFVAWMMVDDLGHERLMVGWNPNERVHIPLLAFDRATEDAIDKMARHVVQQTGRPGRKVWFRREALLGEMF